MLPVGLDRHTPSILTAADSVSLSPAPTLGLYQGLRKAESSLLCQLRTERIGLRAFLSQRKVPGFESATCQRCFLSEETPFHIICECPSVSSISRTQLSSAIGEEVTFWTKEKLRQALSDKGLSRVILRWFLQTNRLPEYRLAVSLSNGGSLNSEEE